MEKVEINKGMKLSPHFTLGELTKTSHKTADGNIPSHVAIENLKNLCENWLELLRSEWNRLYGEGNDPILINSGYRSPAVNKLVKGVATSNHLTGCAVDIHVDGKEQYARYQCILLDISDRTKRDFDELLYEEDRKGHFWLHFAVRPPSQQNRRKISFLRA